MIFKKDLAQKNGFKHTKNEEILVVSCDRERQTGRQTDAEVGKRRQQEQSAGTPV